MLAAAGDYGRWRGALLRSPVLLVLVVMTRVAAASPRVTACAPAGDPIFETDDLYDEGDATRAGTIVRIYANGAWTTIPVVFDRRAGTRRQDALVVRCLDRRSIAKVRTAIDRAPWKVRHPEITCRAYSRSHTVYFVLGTRIIDARTCGAEQLDVQSATAVDEITAQLAASTAADPGVCMPGGEILIEMAEINEQTGIVPEPVGMPPTHTFVIYESGAWKSSEIDSSGTPSHETSGCVAEATLTALRADLARSRWKITNAEAACAAYSPTYVQFASHGKVVWTERVCSGMSLDGISRHAIDELTALAAELRKAKP